MATLGVPVTAFCRSVNILPTAFYSWKNGTIKLSDTTLTRIDEYLKNYNF
jgi:hypothetical protein